MNDYANHANEDITLANEAVHATDDRVVLVERLRETHDRYLRVLADLNNHRRRMAREKAKVERDTKATLLLQILEVFDTLERAFAYKVSKQVTYEKWIYGVHQQLRSILKKNRVDALRTVGRRFDPRYHDAVEIISSSSQPSGTVSKEFKKGYLLEGELLRPARVQVVE